MGGPQKKTDVRKAPKGIAQRNKLRRNIGRRRHLCIVKRHVALPRERGGRRHGDVRVRRHLDCILEVLSRNEGKRIRHCLRGVNGRLYSGPVTFSEAPKKQKGLKMGNGKA